MTSAFEETHPRSAATSDNLLLDSGEDSTRDESDAEEDEEVAMNCIGGFRGMEDSDMNTTDASSDEEEDNDDDDE